MSFENKKSMLIATLDEIEFKEMNLLNIFESQSLKWVFNDFFKVFSNQEDDD